MSDTIKLGFMNDRVYADIKRLQKDNVQTRQFLHSCKKCKIDVDTELEANREQAEILANLLIEFFPGKP